MGPLRGRLPWASAVGPLRGQSAVGVCPGCLPWASAVGVSRGRSSERLCRFPFMCGQTFTLPTVCGYYEYTYLFSFLGVHPWECDDWSFGVNVCLTLRETAELFSRKSLLFYLSLRSLLTPVTCHLDGSRPSGCEVTCQCGLPNE